MKKAFKVVLSAGALSMLAVSGADAQLVSTAPDCGEWLPALYVDCSGAWEGNDSNQQGAVAAEILSQGWLTDVAVTFGVEDGNFGTTGTINFPASISNFVLALKAGDSFSLYYFTDSFSSIDYDTSGSGCNPRCTSVNGLSHWTVYGGNVEVPEPGILVLMGSGLLGMAFVRRRDDVA